MTKLCLNLLKLCWEIYSFFSRHSLRLVYRMNMWVYILSPVIPFSHLCNCILCVYGCVCVLDVLDGVSYTESSVAMCCQQQFGKTASAVSCSVKENGGVNAHGAASSSATACSVNNFELLAGTQPPTDTQSSRTRKHHLSVNASSNVQQLDDVQTVKSRQRNRSLIMAVLGFVIRICLSSLFLSPLVQVIWLAYFVFSYFSYLIHYFVPSVRHTGSITKLYATFNATIAMQFSKLSMHNAHAGVIVVCNAIFCFLLRYFIAFRRYLRSSHKVVQNRCKILMFFRGWAPIFWSSASEVIRRTRAIQIRLLILLLSTFINLGHSQTFDRVCMHWSSDLRY